MTTMNFELAHKQLVVRAPQHRGRTSSGEPVHRPSVALILLATTVQIIAMAAVLGTAASVFN